MTAARRAVPILAALTAAAAAAIEARAVLSPAQLIVVATPGRLSLATWQVPIDPRPADMEAHFGAARECPGGKLRLLFPSLAVTAYLDDPRGDGCSVSPPRAAVLGAVLRGRRRTAEGLGIGSTLAAARRAYPKARPVHGIAPQPGWWDSGLPFVRLRGEQQRFNCAAVEPTGFPCAQRAFQIVRGRVAALSLRTGFMVG